MIRRLGEILGALLLFLLSGLPFSEGKIVWGMVIVTIGGVMLALIIWRDTGGEKKISEKIKASELERVKKLFSLKESELVEVLLTPSDMIFTLKLSLNIQQMLGARYFAVLEREEISVVAQIGDVITKPEKMINPKTLECQFTPIVKKNNLQKRPLFGGLLAFFKYLTKLSKYGIINLRKLNWQF